MGFFSASHGDYMHTVKFSRENNAGIEHEYELPAKFEVCDKCEGHGFHLTPSIGEHAYTREEFEDTFHEEEDRAEYFKRGGIYDVQCTMCNGKRVIAVVDESLCVSHKQKRLLKLYEAIQNQLAEWRAEEARERKYGY